MVPLHPLGAVPFAERKMVMSKAIGIWIRVSTEDQVRGESPEHHEMRARSYADAKGWQVVETYRLNAVSGKAVMQHPEAKRMVADIRSGQSRASCSQSWPDWRGIPENSWSLRKSSAKWGRTSFPSKKR